MFTSKIDAEPSFASWVIQQFAAMIVPGIWAMLFSVVVPNFSNEIVDTIWNVVMVWPAGLIFGLLVGVVYPRAAIMGRWVWVLPSIGWTAMFLPELLHQPLGFVLREFFYATGEEAWGIALFTFPTCSCIGYSLGVLRAKRQSSSSQEQPSLPLA